METVNGHKSPLCDFGILHGPTPTPHIHTKIDDDYCLLTSFSFALFHRRLISLPTPS